MANNLDTLITNLQTIYNEVTTKVKPENIKEGIKLQSEKERFVDLPY